MLATMATQVITVRLSKDVVKRLGELAKRLEVKLPGGRTQTYTRNDCVAEAVAEYLARHEQGGKR